MAQSKYYTNKYGWFDVHNGFIVLQRDNGNYVVGCEVKNNAINQWNLHLLEISPIGTQLDTAGHYWNGYNTAIRDMVKSDDNIFIVGFVSEEIATGNRYSYFAACDSNNYYADFDIIGDETFSNVVSACVMTDDHNYLIGGRITTASPGWSELYLVKLDADYEMLWDTVYTTIPINYPSGMIIDFNYNYNTYINDIAQGPGDSYYLLATADDNWGWDDTGFALLMRIDGAGNILWAQHFDLGADEQTYSLLVTLDGGLLFTAVTDQTTFDLCMGYVRKLSADGETEWTWQAPAAVPQVSGNTFLGYPHKAIQLADSSYVITGDWGVADAPDSDGTLVKLSPSGGFQWQHSYGNPYNDYFYDLIVADHDSTGKSGYVVVGRTDTIGRADVWFLRLNCMGLLTEPQAAFAYQTTAGSNLVELVNQSQYVYPDSIDGGHYIWDFGDGSPPFRCGQGYGACPDVVTHEYAAAQGQHTITLRAVVCSDTSAVTASVALGSGIGGQSVGVEVVEAIEEAAANPTPTLLHFVPNPASNTTTLHYDLSDKKGNSETATLHLYDLVGKLLHTQTLNGQGSYTLDLNSFGQGLYVYDISNSYYTWTRGKLIVTK
ncbi:MAG: T9SS type A sorting domain-containing protein [Sphingobacteriales bacterium]|nr:T9SS type A sorting domain-containing protein [Sphingobacteriales bacterium]